MNHLPALAARFRFNERVLGRAVDGLEGADWLRPAVAGGSHALWLLGHIAASRRTILRGIGRERPRAAWEEFFGKGSRPGDGPGESSPAELLADIAESGTILESHLATLDADQASAPFPRKLPDGATTIDGALHFFHWHESYHIGQLGLLRRVSGKGGIA